MQCKHLGIKILILVVVGFTYCTANNYRTQNMNTKINIIIGSKTFKAILYNNVTAKKFKSMLPLTLNMKDLNSNEKYFHFSQKLPTNPSSPKTIQSGDLMIWNSNSLVLFYKTFSTNYSYTKLGYIEDTKGLEKAVGFDNINITFTSGE
jgi:hypothetical protein